jgi:Right handed beta helix region
MEPVRFVALFIFLGLLAGRAQPSGGPYGPLHIMYDLPKDAAHVYYVAPDGQSSASGATLTEPTTLESAFEKVVTGDAIILRGGTYRTGNLKFNQGVTLQPYADEQPVLKGTVVVTDWVEQTNSGLWRISWTNHNLFPSKPADWWRREREGTRTPFYRFNNDMIFVDGQLLTSVGWDGEVRSNSYFIDYDSGQIYLGVSPTNHLIEITTFDNALTRTTSEVHGKIPDHKGPVIRGITFTQYAYRALEVEGREPAGLSDPATFGKDVTNTVLENLTISFCSRVAGYFRGDNLIIRHCLISDTRTEGIYVIGSADVLLEKNIFRRNNIQQITGYFPAAVKIFNQCYRATCRDNLVIDQPHSNGIWYDVGNVDGVFVDNHVENAMDGFFFEISKRAICAGNVFVNCEHGIRVLNSTNVQAYHNTLLNAVVSFERSDRSGTNDHFGWHPLTGPNIEQREGHVFAGNLLVADETFRRPFLVTTQSQILCGTLTNSQLARLDDNVYVRQGASGGQPWMVWSPTGGTNFMAPYATWEEFRQAHPQFEQRGKFLNGDYGSIFKCAELGNYDLIQALPEMEDSLPPNVRQLLGWSKQGVRPPGAYPLRRQIPRSSQFRPNCCLPRVKFIRSIFCAWAIQNLHWSAS